MSGGFDVPYFLCTYLQTPPPTPPATISSLLYFEFSDFFLTTIVPNVDRLLILSDFNILVCCLDKPLVS